MAVRSLSIVLTAAATLFLVSCASKQLPATSPAEILSAPAKNEYIIQPGDQLEVKFFYNPELNEMVTVRPDGKISLQLIDDLKAAGLRPEELDEEITNKYSGELQKPLITVIVRSFTAQRVYVGGEVNIQGLIDLDANMTPLQAVLKAGGFKETANPSAAIIIRKGLDNKPVPFRVDLKDALYGGAVGRLTPQDVVYVPKTFIAEANKFVNQYIENLLLFKGVSLGFSYELHSESADILR